MFKSVLNNNWSGGENVGDEPEAIRNKCAPDVHVDLLDLVKDGNELFRAWQFGLSDSLVDELGRLSPFDDDLLLKFDQLLAQDADSLQNALEVHLDGIANDEVASDCIVQEVATAESSRHGLVEHLPMNKYERIKEIQNKKENQKENKKKTIFVWQIKRKDHT